MAERNTSQPASTSPSASGVGDLLVRVADKFLDADRCSFLVDARERFEVVATTDDADANRTYDRSTGIPSQAFDTGMACVVDDCLDTRSASATPPEPTAAADQMRSLCCVPVEGLGLLLGEAYRPDAFNAIEKDLLVRFVDTVLESAGDADEAVQPVEDGGRRLDDEPDRFEQIADILSHDLVNPLNVVSGNIGLAKESGDEMYLQRAEDALDRVHKILDEVVLIARTGDLIEDIEPVDLEAATQTAWANIEAGEAPLEVVASTSIDADLRALCHLIENLLDNAVTHAGPGVTIRVGPTDRGFFVEDDGPGIPADQRQRVLDRGVSLGRESTGLGLHIVHQIADAHGWEVTVSESGAGGARFEIETHTELSREKR